MALIIVLVVGHSINTPEAHSIDLIALGAVSCAPFLGVAHPILQFKVLNVVAQRAISGTTA